MTVLYDETRAELDDLYSALRPDPPLPARMMPLDPLLDRFCGDTAALAKAAGVSRRSVQRWAKKGLTFIRADEVCAEVNEIACHVWLDWHLQDQEIAEAAAFALRLTLTRLQQS